MGLQFPSTRQDYVLLLFLEVNCNVSSKEGFASFFFEKIHPMGLCPLDPQDFLTPKLSVKKKKGEVFLVSFRPWFVDKVASLRCLATFIITYYYRWLS